MKTAFITGSWSKVKRFSRDERGQFALFFAVAALPAFLAIGAALDYSRAASARTNLQLAADSAVLALSRNVTATSTGASLRAQAAAFLAGSAGDTGAVLEKDPELSANRSTLCLYAMSNAPTTFMRLAQIDTIKVSAFSCTDAADALFEIALVVDTTGSMANSASGKTKLQAMQTAAKNFVDTMFTSSTLASRTKIALVPFAEAVRVDPATYRTAAWLDQGGVSPRHWENWDRTTAMGTTAAPVNRFDVYNWLKAKSASWDWAGCVESRTYPYNTNDSAPSVGTPASLYVPMLNPDEVDSGNYYDDYIDDGKGVCTSNPAGESQKQWRACKYKNATVRNSSAGPNAVCSTQPMMRLSESTASSAIKAKIDTLTAAGSTNVHEGLAWGWRAISPNAPFGDGRVYGFENNNKVIVLMTDGENTWSSMNNAITKSTYSAYGYYTTANPRLAAANQNISNATASRAAIDQLTRETCTNAKAAGVRIYTIGFSTASDPIDAQGLQLLKDCASRTDYYYTASNATDLNNAYAAIAAGIGKLRITR